MTPPTGPYVARPRGKSGCSLPLMVAGAATAVLVGYRYDGLLGGFTLVGAVLVAKVLDEFAAKAAKRDAFRAPNPTPHPTPER